MASKRTPLNTPIRNAASRPLDIVFRAGEKFYTTTGARSAACTKDYIRQQQEHKLNILLEQYGIEPSHPDVWKQLAIELAKERYVGFRVADVKTKNKMQHAGRDTIWTPHLLGLLWVDAELIQVRQKMTTRACLRLLLKRSPWVKLMDSSGLKGDAFEGKVMLLDSFTRIRKISELNSSTTSTMRAFLFFRGRLSSRLRVERSSRDWRLFSNC